MCACCPVPHYTIPNRPITTQTHHNRDCTITTTRWIGRTHTSRPTEKLATRVQIARQALCNTGPSQQRLQHYNNKTVNRKNTTSRPKDKLATRVQAARSQTTQFKKGPLQHRLHHYNNTVIRKNTYFYTDREACNTCTGSKTGPLQQRPITTKTAWLQQHGE